MSALHSRQQEISGRQVWTGSIVLAHALSQRLSIMNGMRYDQACGQDPNWILTFRFVLSFNFWLTRTLYLLFIRWLPSILELGAGTGILGMYLARKAQARCVALTDGDDKAVRLLQDNLKDSDNKVGANIQATILRWGENNEQFLSWCRSKWPEFDSKFDCIVAGDVLYKSNLPPLFFETARSLLAPSGTLWLCHVPRANVTYEIVLEAARQAEFIVTDVPLEFIQVCGCPVEDVSRARVYQMIKSSRS
jgi:SAM-dependent methyltransferase